MYVLIVMWLVVQPVCSDAMGCLGKSTAVAMQEFSTQARCEGAKEQLGRQPGMTAFCVPK